VKIQLKVFWVVMPSSIVVEYQAGHITRLKETRNEYRIWYENLLEN